MHPPAGLTIDGDAVHTTDQIEVIDPATEKVVGTAPDASRDDVEHAVDAAARAFRAWAADSDVRTVALRETAQRPVSRLPSGPWRLSNPQGDTPRAD